MSLLAMTAVVLSVLVTRVRQTQTEPRPATHQDTPADEGAVSLEALRAAGF